MWNLRRTTVGRATAKLLITLTLAGLAGAACRDSTAPVRGSSGPASQLGLVTGALTVSTTTSGSNLDPDGYTVTVDVLLSSSPIAPNGSVTFTDVPPGVAVVTLSGVAGNCTVTTGNPQVVTVPIGGTAGAAFSIDCGEPSPRPRRRRPAPPGPRRGRRPPRRRPRRRHRRRRRRRRHHRRRRE